MKILRIIDSPLKTKRFRIYLDNNKHFDFGVKDKHETYIDHKDKVRREISIETLQLRKRTTIYSKSYSI